MIPYLAACQNLPAIGEQLKKCDVRFRTELILKAPETPESKGEISSESIGIVANLGDPRSFHQFVDEDAFLSIDDRRSHVHEEIPRLLRDTRVIVTIWSPDRTQIFE
jgi:hypothetical protein